MPKFDPALHPRDVRGKFGKAGARRASRRTASHRKLNVKASALNVQVTTPKRSIGLQASSQGVVFNGKSRNLSTRTRRF